MYHLSKELTGVLLNHDTHGSHLDSAGKTIDPVLEEKNFEAAGQTLCAIWNELEIDGFQTVAEYLKDPPIDEITSFVASAKFRSDHVFESQYMTVYLKCRNENCCEPFKTDIELFFPHRSIPPLIPIKKTMFGVEALTRTEALESQKLEFLPLSLRVVYNNKLVGQEDNDKFGSVVPYDLFLPTVQDKLLKRCCQNCGKYHASVKSLGVHRKNCKKPKKSKQNKNGKKALFEDEFCSESDEEESSFEAFVNDEESEEDEYAAPSNVVNVRPSFSVTFQGEFVERIVNLKEWLKSPWVTDDEVNNNS